MTEECLELDFGNDSDNQWIPPSHQNQVEWL